MAEVHRLQALLASHDASHTASTLSQVESWVHWPQSAWAFLIALLIGWASLLLGFHHKGRPFGSRKAIMHTVILLIVTALIASVLSILVPHLPLSLGIFIPALLCGAVLKENEAIQELRLANDMIAAFVTIGISILLEQATEQMSNDRSNWCDDLIEKFEIRDASGAEDELASLRSFSVAAGQLLTGLSSRISEKGGKKHRDLIGAEDHHAAVYTAIRAAVKAHSLGDIPLFRKEYESAKIALQFLLQIAYNWRYGNIIKLARITNPERRYEVI
jgi:uncharacterized membrane protein YvlD (DUF360 family)